MGRKIDEGVVTLLCADPMLQSNLRNLRRPIRYVPAIFAQPLGFQTVNKLHHHLIARGWNSYSITISYNGLVDHVNLSPTMYAIY